MIRARLPGVAKLVCILGKKEAEQGEEKSGNLEPENATRVSEGSPDRFAEISCAACDCPATFGSAFNVNRGLLLHSRGFLLHGMSGLRGAIANHAGGDTDADAKFPAKTVRLHIQKCSSGILIHIASIEHRK